MRHQNDLPADKEHQFSRSVGHPNNLVRLKPLVEAVWLPRTLSYSLHAGLLHLPLAAVLHLKGLDQVRTIQVLFRFPGAFLLWEVEPFQQIFCSASPPLLK